MEFQLKENNIVADTRASAILYHFLMSQNSKGDVLLPVNICSIVAHIFVHCGFTIQYVDINSEHWCIDAEKILVALNQNKKIVGILLNHTYGTPHDFSDAIELIKQHSNVFIVEDKCLCFPDLETNEHVDLTLYSTGYAKCVELENHGGYGIVKRKIKRKQTSFSILNETIVCNDSNGNLTEYFNTITQKGEAIKKRKNEINSIYEKYISNYSIAEQLNNWRYTIMVKNRDELKQEIFENKLFASNHYKPLHDDRIAFSNAWYIYNHVLNLFNDHYVTIDYAKQIVQLITKYDTI